MEDYNSAVSHTLEKGLVLNLHLYHSEGICLASLVNERLKELLLADTTVVVLVHRSKVLAELGLIELGVRLDALEHLQKEFAYLRFLESTVCVSVYLSEKLFSGLHKLSLSDLGHVFFVSFNVYR